MKDHIQRRDQSPGQTHQLVQPPLPPRGGTVHAVSLLVATVSITLSEGENALLRQECVGCSLQVTG